jgi:hypothetical protein
MKTDERSVLYYEENKLAKQADIGGRTGYTTLRTPSLISEYIDLDF